MAIDASFIHSTASIGNLTVTFTDTSTGGPDSWLWDFGDGGFSSIQNPTHTFASPIYFNVTLYAWINDVSNEIGMGTPNNSAIKTFLNTGAGQDCATAWAWAQATNYTTSGISGRCAWMIQKWSADICAYISYRMQFTYTPPSDLSITPVIQGTWIETDPFIELNRTIETSAGEAQVRVIEGSNIDLSFSAGTQVGKYHGLTSGTVEYPCHSKRGIPSTWELWPVQTNLNGIADEVNMGGFMMGDIKIVEHQAVVDEHDWETQTIFVGFIPPPQVIIDFVGTPLLGTSPMEVDFTDLSNVQSPKFSKWEFGDGNIATFAGTTHPTNTYLSDHCSVAAS